MDEILKAQMDKIDKLGVVPFPEELRSKVRDGTIPECRVIFLGNGGNGKSSLIERILYDTADSEKKPTTGIDTFWGLTTARRIEKPDKAICCLRFMDFGGQEIQNNIHRCFMTAHTIYVLVCDLEKARNSTSSNDALEQISGWLYETSRYAPGSPVLVALNKSDLEERRETPSPLVAQRRAGAINGAVHDVLITSAVKENRDEAVKGLIEAIRTEIKRLLKTMEKQRRWQKDWLAVRWELEEKNQSHISYADFQAICRRHMILPFQQKKLLTWLQNQGAFYVCSEKVSDLPALLHPVWLAKRIYHVISYIPPEQGCQSGTSRQYLIHHEDVIRVLLCLDTLTPEEMVSVTPLELSDRMNGELDVKATEKARREKDFLLAVMRRLSLSFLWGYNEEAFPSRMTEEENPWQDTTEQKDTQRGSQNALHQRWIVVPISESGYTPPFRDFILRDLMCGKADFLTRPEKNCANHVQFVQGDYTIYVTLDKSQMDIYLWGNADANGKRFLKEFRDLVRKSFKHNRISATEYAFDEDTSYAVEDLKVNARVELNTAKHRTGRDIMRRYDLPMGRPFLIKKARSRSVSALQKATRFLALFATVTVAIILLVFLWKPLPRGENSPISVTDTDTVPESVDVSMSTSEQESAYVRPAEDSAEDAEHRANARLTDAKRILLILAVAVGAMIVAASLFLRIAKPQAYHAVLDWLKDILNLIKQFQN